jgi:hypothetical protein
MSTPRRLGWLVLDTEIHLSGKRNAIPLRAATRKAMPETASTT